MRNCTYPYTTLPCATYVREEWWWGRRYDDPSRADELWICVGWQGDKAGGGEGGRGPARPLHPAEAQGQERRLATWSSPAARRRSRGIARDDVVWASSLVSYCPTVCVALGTVDECPSTSPVWCLLVVRCWLLNACLWFPCGLATSRYTCPVCLDVWTV